MHRVVVLYPEGNVVSPVMVRIVAVLRGDGAIAATVDHPP